MDHLFARNLPSRRRCDRSARLSRSFSRSCRALSPLPPPQRGFNNRSYTPQARGFDHFYGHYNADVDAWNKTFGFVATDSSPITGLDWHRANSTGEVLVRGTVRHSCPLIAGEFDRLMDARDTPPPTAGPLRPLFAYVAFHMVHLADGNDSGGGSPYALCKKAKCLEAPLGYGCAVNRVSLILSLILSHFLSLTLSISLSHPTLPLMG